MAYTLSAEYPQETSRADEWSYPVAASTGPIYKGSLVMSTSGYAVVGANTQYSVFLGVALETVDNSTGAAGDKWVRVARKGSFKFGMTSDATPPQTWVNVDLYITDDNHVDLVGVSAYVKVGRCIRIDPDNKAVIDIATK
jgi:hypothetical protein